jgi:hypothetical protein
MAKANVKKIKFLNLIMNHKQGFFNCLQCELGDCWTLASIKPDLLDFLASVFLQFSALKVLSSGIFKALGFNCGGLTKIFKPEAITSYLLSITLGVH